MGTITTTTTTVSTTSTTTTTTTTELNVEPFWSMQTTISPVSNSIKGEFGSIDLCPSGSYATSFELLVAPLCDRRCLLDDDVGLMGIRLTCADYHNPFASTGVVTSRVSKNITRAGGGSVLGFGWKSKKSCPDGRFLNSARYLSEFLIVDNVGKSQLT